MTYKAIITEIKEVHKEVLEITLKLPEEYPNIIPGQFIVINIAEGIKRAYSILDFDNDTIKLLTKKVEGGKGTSIIFSEYKEGMIIDITKPTGKKLIVDKSSNITLVATGIGIVPIYCILKDLAASNHNVELIYGSRYLDDLYYNDKILEVIKDTNIKYTQVLSREYIEGIHKGYVTDVIRCRDLSDRKIYMCSSKQVAESFKSVLDELGFDINNFKHECN